MGKSAREEVVLVVDDSRDTLEMIQRNLSEEGYTVLTAGCVEDAIGILEGTGVDIVITDLRMPKVGGMELVRHVRENYGDTEIMMITGFATIDGAVEAVKAGAEEYLTKPFTSEELLSAVDRATEKLGRRRSGRREFGRKLRDRHGLLGESKEMERVLKSISKAASTAATILIRGESGTGKELVARAIHYTGKRASAPFVPVNCGGIPESLLESELFGYVKGAFTGALESRAGFFQTADGGTIFLDEISETSLSMQVKLLRVLQDREIRMVGSSKPSRVDVRILAATNKDLRELVKRQVFREDLYYRLDVISINVPPLRERADDVLLLAGHFAERFSREMDKPVPRFSDRVLEVMRQYFWPGNVRELENLVQRLVVMSDDEVIDVPDLPSLMRYSGARESGLDRTLEEVESDYIRNVLASVDGNKTRAAEILGIDRKTLRQKLKKIHPDA